MSTLSPRPSEPGSQPATPWSRMVCSSWPRHGAPHSYSWLHPSNLLPVHLCFCPSPLDPEDGSFLLCCHNGHTASRDPEDPGPPRPTRGGPRPAQRPGGSGHRSTPDLSASPMRSDFRRHSGAVRSVGTLPLLFVICYDPAGLWVPPNKHASPPQSLCALGSSVTAGHRAVS